MPPRPSESCARGFRAQIPHLPPLLLFLVLALAVGWPLWLHPASRIAGRGDALLNSYILDWVHFALFHQLAGFFQATVFWPHADSLAYGEHLLVPALLALPLRLLTSSAVALHNLSVVQAFFFSAASAYALGFFYFHKRAPAIVAGLVYGFAQYRIVQFGHIQLAHGEFLPLGALAIEMLLLRESRGGALLLLAMLVAQALTSWYWAVFTVWTLGPFLAMRLWQSRATLTRGILLHFLIPCVAAVLITLPIAMPYITLQRKNVLVRPDVESRAYSAQPVDFFRVAPRYWTSGAAPENAASAHPAERALFPGVAATLVCALGFAMCVRRRPFNAPVGAAFPRRAWAGLFLMLLIFSFGSFLGLGGKSSAWIPLPYVLVEKLFPFAGGIRVAARWILPALLPASMIAAYGVVCVEEFLRRRGARIPAAALPFTACALLAFESLPQPAKFAGVPTAPPESCVWLAKQPYPNPVIELPILADDDNLYMLHATWHRQPTMNGTNGFFPPGHLPLLREVGAFSSPDVLTKLRDAQVRHIIIHTAAYPRARMNDTPVGRLLNEAETRTSEGEFTLKVFGQPLKARRIGGDLVIVL